MFHPTLGENLFKVTCLTISPHLYILSYIRFPTPVHAVLHTSIPLTPVHTVLHTSVSLHLYILSYIQDLVFLSHLYILSYIQVFPHTCAYCPTYKCFLHTCIYTVLHMFPHTCIYCPTCFPTPVYTVQHMFPYTCINCPT